MADNDTEQHSGEAREKTDPGFPGPPSSQSHRAAVRSDKGTDPGFPSAPAQPIALPHEVRVSDTLPAAPKVSDDAKAEAEVERAADRPKTPSVSPPRPRSSHPPPARAESIDELLDGLAGEGILPRKSKNPPSESAKAAGPRPPAAPMDTPDVLPPVVVKTDSQDGGDVAPAPITPEGRDAETVLTPEVFARKNRGGVLLAGVLGIMVAVGALALLRKMTQSPDGVAPVTTVSATTVSTGAPTQVPTSTSSVEVVPSAVPSIDVKPTTTAAPPIEPSVSAKGATPAAPSTSGRKTNPPATSSSSSLGDFQKTIRN